MSQEMKVEKSHLRLLLLVPILLIGYLIAIYVVQPFAAEGTAWMLLDANSIVLALICALVFAIVAHRFSWLTTKPGQISLLIAIGFVLWTIAELFWFLDEAAGVLPFPSTADIFYVSGYIPFALALLLNIRTIHVKFSTAMLVLWITISAVVLVLITYFAILPVLSGYTGIGAALGATYPFEDFVIIVLAMIIVLKFRAGQIAKAWGLLVVGFFMEAIADIWFNLAQSAGTYVGPYEIVDLVLSIAYVTIFTSGLVFIMTFGARGGHKSA